MNKLSTLTVLILTTITLNCSGSGGIFGSFIPEQPQTVIFASDYFTVESSEIDAIYTSGDLASETVELGENETLVFISPNENSLNNVRVEVTIGETTAVNPFVYVIAGPATVKFLPSVDIFWQGGDSYGVDVSSGGVSFFVVDRDENADSSESAVLTIPGATGDTFELILEESTDLVNWSASVPGNKTAGSTPRFFRLSVKPQN